MKRNNVNLIVILLCFLLNSIYSLAQLPDNFSVLTLNNPAPGYLLLGPNKASTLSLIDNSGFPVHVSNMDASKSGISNIQLWSNGLATFWAREAFSGVMAFYAINDKYEIVDTFAATSQYETDYHEFQWLSNGHYLILGVNYRTIDMSTIVQNGCPNARVEGYNIQEFDRNHNLVWEWNTFDHFPITDATPDIDLTSSYILYCHINSFFIDTDGNLVISSRHLDEVTKINKSTGDIMWRLGGTKCKNNQFTFTNDTHDNFIGFSHQHDVQRLPNGHLILFDNGNLKTEKSSRAVEYEINEVTKTVTKVWEYYHNPAIFTEAMGSVQRLPNGNTLIGWSFNNLNITCTELDPMFNNVFEMSMVGTMCYRVYRQVFKMAASTRNVSSLANYNFTDYNNNTNISLTVSELTGNGDVQMEAHYYTAHNQIFRSDAPREVYPSRWVMTSKSISKISGKMVFDLDSINTFQSPELLAVYYRSKEGTGSFERLATAYNAATRKLEAAFSGLGEYIIGMPFLEPPLHDSPANNSSDLKIPVRIKWKNLFNAISYRLQVSTSPLFNDVILDSAGIVDTSLVVSRDFISDYTKYYWRINAEKNSQTTAWSDYWSFTTELIPPNLVTPSDSAINLQIKGNLTWDKVPMADAYHVQISEQSDFGDVITDGNVKNTEFTYKNLKFNRLYYWRVGSKNGSYSSHWSSVRCFFTKLDTVRLVLPNDNFTGINPKSSYFGWNKLEGVDVYRLQISKDSLFSILDKNIFGIKDTFFIETGLDYNEKYFWRVSGLGKICSGDWSVTRNVITSIGPPILIQPNNYSRNLTITGLLRWENIKNSQSYHLQIATDSMFKNIVQDKDNYPGFSFTYQNFLYDTKYFWRVLVYTSNGINSEWSDVWEFQTRQEFYIDQPILKTPGTEQYNVPITGFLTWEESPSTISYRVQLSLENTFDYPIIDIDGITNTELDYGLLNYNKIYFWRVLANGEKSKSEWSETGTFSTKLETPNLLIPANRATKVSINTPFKWSPIDGATSYFVQFGKDEGFYQRTDKTVYLNEFSNIEWLSGFTKYYWRVMGIGGKKESEWSDVWSFTTDNLNSVIDYFNNNFSMCTYPNPFNDYLIVSFKTDKLSNARISVFDNKGQPVILTFEQSVGIGNYQIYLNAKDWNDGSYYIKIELNNEIKFIKGIKIRM